MKIVSFINEAPVINKILKHLFLWNTEHLGKSLSETTYEEMIECLPLDTDWSDYEEPGITPKLIINAGLWSVRLKSWWNL